MEFPETILNGIIMTSATDRNMTEKKRFFFFRLFSARRSFWIYVFGCAAIISMAAATTTNYSSHLLALMFARGIKCVAMSFYVNEMPIIRRICCIVCCQATNQEINNKIKILLLAFGPSQWSIDTIFLVCLSNRLRSVLLSFHFHCYASTSHRNDFYDAAENCEWHLWENYFKRCTLTSQRVDSVVKDVISGKKKISSNSRANANWRRSFLSASPVRHTGCTGHSHMQRIGKVIKNQLCIVLSLSSRTWNSFEVFLCDDDDNDSET